MSCLEKCQACNTLHCVGKTCPCQIRPMLTGDQLFIIRESLQYNLEYWQDLWNDSDGSNEADQEQASWIRRIKDAQAALEEIASAK